MGKGQQYSIHKVHQLPSKTTNHHITSALKLKQMTSKMIKSTASGIKHFQNVEYGCTELHPKSACRKDPTTSVILLSLSRLSHVGIMSTWNFLLFGSSPSRPFSRVDICVMDGTARRLVRERLALSRDIRICSWTGHGEVS